MQVLQKRTISFSENICKAIKYAHDALTSNEISYQLEKSIDILFWLSNVNFVKRLLMYIKKK